VALLQGVQKPTTHKQHITCKLFAAVKSIVNFCRCSWIIHPRKTIPLENQYKCRGWNGYYLITRPCVLLWFKFKDLCAVQQSLYTDIDPETSCKDVIHILCRTCNTRSCWQLSGGYFILLTTSAYGVGFLDVRIIEPQVPSVFENLQKSTTCL